MLGTSVIPCATEIVKPRHIILRLAVLPEEMRQAVDGSGACEKRTHTHRYSEHFRKRPERKSLVQIAGENRFS
jgi:hypothetical protein